MSNYTTVAALSSDLVERLAKECSATSASTVPGQPWVIGKKDLFLLLNRVHAMGRSHLDFPGRPVHPGYLIQVSPACLNFYLTSRTDEDDEGGKLKRVPADRAAAPEVATPAEPQIPEDFRIPARTAPEWRQMHVGVDPDGKSLWHSGVNGLFWLGQQYDRTPHELEAECLSTIADLRRIYADRAAHAITQGPAQ